MQDLYKGFIPTKDKVPLKKFKDASDLLTLDEAEKLPEYAGLLAENVILIDIDDYERSEKLMDIVEALQLNCRVCETTRGKHFYFYGGNINKCATHIKLAIGLEADIKVGNHNSISVLKYKGAKRKIIYDIEPDESYQAAPDWLIPVRSKTDFTTLGEGDGRNQTLFNYILTLQSAGLANDTIKTTIKLINDYVLPSKLDDMELNKILRDEAFNKPNFYDNKGFRHDWMGQYLINNSHVIILNDQLHIYNGGVYVTGKRQLERKMVELVDTIKINQRREVMGYLENKAPVVKDTADANYIAFKNGILNLSTRQMENFRPDIIITNMIPHNYNYHAYSADMDAVLDRLSCNDNSIRDLLEEMAGYCLYRRNELRKAFILIGDKANGKSTYLDCIVNMVGHENTSALDLKELGDRFRTAALFGKLINAGDDIGDEFIPDASIFKKVVSGDRIIAENKGQQPFEFNNYSKFIFSANNIPRIKDKTGAVLDRLIIIPFNATFTKDSPDYDPYIKYKLRSEEAMEYLIQVGLDGLKRVLANSGFTVSEKVVDELEKYNEQNNPVVGFFKEVDVEVDILNQPTKDVYVRYTLYCNENNLTPVAKNQFSLWLKKECGITSAPRKANNKSIRVYVREV